MFLFGLIIVLQVSKTYNLDRVPHLPACHFPANVNTLLKIVTSGWQFLATWGEPYSNLFSRTDALAKKMIFWVVRESHELFILEAQTCWKIAS